jgi:hypothetical protein
MTGNLKYSSDSVLVIPHTTNFYIASNSMAFFGGNFFVSLTEADLVESTNSAVTLMINMESQTV